MKIISGVNSWSDFQAALSSLPNLEKGHVFEDLVSLSLQINPRDTTKYKRVWKIRRTNRSQDSVPLNVRKKLNLPEPDLGIDLLAETFEGEYHAIQCKYHSDTEDSVALKEVTQGVSLAFSHCKGVSHFILATSGGSGGKRSRHLKGYAGGKLSIRDIGEWRRLDKLFFDNARKVLASRKSLKPVAYKPRKHQSRAIKNALQHFVREKHDRGKMIMPCGSGKSLTGFWIAQQMGAKKIVVAVPSLALVKQTLEVWAEQSVANRISVSWICVCSDKSVGQSEDEDSVQLQDLGVKVHTDPSDIAKWLRKRFEGLKVVFTTYQSGEALSNAATIARCRFDFGVFDEAHKTVGNKDKAFAHLLFDENIRIKRRMFMTATERRYIGSGESILSMHDPEVYGETFDLLSFKEALECEPPILSDYKIVTIEVGEEELKRELAKNILVKPDKGRWVEAQEIRTLAAALAIRKATKKFGVKHIISFHSSVARAQAFQKTHDRITDAVPEYGKLDTYHVSSQQNTGQRQDTIRAFASSEKSLITNARCLTEGVDIKQVDCVVFADPKRSTVDIVQAAGRALRPCEGKKRGYIVIPIPVSGKTVEKRIEESEEFRDVMMTLRALASNDERIIEYFKAVSEGKKFSKGEQIFEHVSFEASALDLSAFKSKIELVAWNKLAKLSWRPFEEARKFASSLNLQSFFHWLNFAKTKKRPMDVPANPNIVYKGKGWVSWGDWLGTNFVATNLRQYRSFKSARDYSRSLAVANVKEWRKFCRSGNLPKDVPASPDKVYKETEWVSWGDWLGNEYVSCRLRKYLKFEDAKKYVKSLGIKSSQEWQAYCKSGRLPGNIPANPRLVYDGNGWNGMGDWLSTHVVAPQNRRYLSFIDARKYVRSLKFENWKEWVAFTKSVKFPPNIPKSPATVYAKKGWSGGGDWIGSSQIAARLKVFKKFSVARRIVRSLGLKSGSEWRAFCKSGELPSDIPSNPDKSYEKKGWINWGDWLGTKSVATRKRKYLEYDQARDLVRALGLKCSQEWAEFSQSEKLPANIPANPRKVYLGTGWVSMGDWLGTTNIAPRLIKFRSFLMAREYARSLNLKNWKEWVAFAKTSRRPKDIPSNPSKTYEGKGWRGMGDWLGTGQLPTKGRKWLAFKKARTFVHTLNLTNVSEWRDYAKSGNLPSNIPSNPDKTYSEDGWKGIPDWLGTEKRSKKADK